MTEGLTAKEVYEMATNPQQYDKPSGTGWDGQGESVETRARIDHYLTYLSPHTQELGGKDFLDVGAGTGWLVDHAVEMGAKTAVGIEPSESNVAVGKFEYPRARLINTSLEEYRPTDEEQYDTVTSVMAVGHISDLPGAFEKMGGLLKPHEPELLVVVPDYDHFTRPRNGYADVVVFQNKPGEVFQATIKHDGSALADIIRTPDRIRADAHKAGLVLTHDIPMPPTEGYMQAVPRYRANRGRPMTRLMRFTA